MFSMKRITIAAALIAGFAASAVALTDPRVGGAAMYPTKNIVENAVKSPIHTTLVAAVKAAGLVDTLEGAGPFTVFAPVNSAFAALPPGTVDTLLKPENKDQLTKVLTYHVVAGRLSTRDLMMKIREGHGSATLDTVAGVPLTVTSKRGLIYLTDATGKSAVITIPNVYQSNGVIQVINKVLLPSG